MTPTGYPILIERAPLRARFEIAGARALMIDCLQAAGLPVPEAPSTLVAGPSDVEVAWAGPRRMIVSAPLAERSRLGTALRSARGPTAAFVAVDVTGATVTFILKGTGVGDVLAQGFPHDFALLKQAPHRIAMTDGWGVAALLDCRDDSTRVTVDATLADYLQHMLRTAAGLPTTSKPGVMSAPPTPIQVSG